MLAKNSLKFLERLLKTCSPSGFENEAAAEFRGYLGSFCHKVSTDVLGNVIGVLNPDAPFKVMLAGHYDEIGFQIVNIGDDGLLNFRANGGIDRSTLPGTEVLILTDAGKVPGIIGRKPIHLTKDEDRNKVGEIKDMWIDIGVESKKAAEQLVAVGDPAAVAPNFKLLGKDKVKVMSKGLDDKIGAFVAAETIRELSARKLDIGVYCVGTVQEELGLRGARTSSFGVCPNVGFAIDVDFATDLPDIGSKELGVIKLGLGAVVCRSADINQVLYRRLIETAKKHKIAHQPNAGFRATGGTDTSAIQMSGPGVATALVSVPNRYMHTPVELCDLRDTESAIKLLVETIAAFKPSDTFIPGID